MLSEAVVLPGYMVCTGGSAGSSAAPAGVSTAALWMRRGRWQCRQHLRQWRWVLGGAVWAARVAVVGRTLADGAHMPTLQQRSRPKHACAHAERGTQASNLKFLAEILSSRRLKPSALVPATSHLLNIMSVSTIRMLAGFGQPYMRGPSPPSARLKLSFLATVSTLQARRLNSRPVEKHRYWFQDSTEIRKLHFPLSY